MTKRMAIFGALLAGAVAGDALGAQPAGNLVFCRRRKSEAGTYLANADGGDLNRILWLCGPEISPRFAPDGKLILFGCVKAGKGSVWMADRNGEGRKEVCEGDQPAWAPDGSRVFFRRAGQIVERVLQSGQERVVSPPGWKSCAFPDCSPGGKSLLFVAEAEGRAKLFVTAPGGGEERKALAELGVVSPARWSPEGRRIAYSDGTHIFIMGADGSGRFRLTTGGGLDRYPAWSPDGTMVAYCHAPTVNAGWVLCVATADGKQTRALLKEDEALSHFGADWHAAGAKPAESAEALRPPPRVVVWHTAGSPGPGPAQWNEWVRKREGWKPASDTRAPEEGLALENGRAVLVLDPKASLAFLYPKPMAEQGAELAVVGERGEEAGKIASLTLKASDGESAEVEVRSATGGGRTARTLWRMTGGGPYVGVSLAEGAGCVRVRAAMRYAAIADRFGDDLVYEPESYAGARVALPETPMVLGFAGSGDTVVELAAPGHGQAVDLLKEAGEPKSFSAAEARLDGAGVIVGVLAGKRLWYKERPNVKYERKRVELRWEMPCAGAWRLALRVGGAPFSEMFMEKGSPRYDNKKLFLTSEEEFSGVVELALVYLYGASAGTPQDTWTPADVALDGMGAERFAEAFDIAGLQSYRTAPRKTTWADISATLRSLGHLYSRGVEKAERTFADHLCDDIPAFIEGMDGRLDELAAFSRGAAELAKLPAGASPGAQAFFAKVKPGLDKLAEACKLREKLTPAAEVVACAAQVKELTSKDFKDQADKKKAFSALSDKLSEAAKRRADLVKALRRAARELRWSAAMACAEQPELRPVAARIRQLAHGVLRNRYYFEGDWRGELLRPAFFWLGGAPY